MRNIPALLQTALDSGVTSLCSAWILTRNDGFKLGFTDHDRDFTLQGTLCRADTGLDGSEISEKLGFNISGSEVSGALQAESLTPLDIEKGVYDGAKVELFRVNWASPQDFIMLRSGIIGEISREGASFRAEIRSLAYKLDEEQGRYYTPTCCADFGDSYCKKSLSDAAHFRNGVVTHILSQGEIKASGLENMSEGAFTQGLLTWLSGQNIGGTVEVSNHRGDKLALWQKQAGTITVGDSFKVSVGCDKRFSTCKTRFNNAVNFRGFPHMPGNDFLSKVPLPDDNMNLSAG